MLVIRMPNKLLAAALLLVAVPAVAVPAQPPAPTDTRRVLADLEVIRSLHPRLEGSASEHALLDFVEARIEALGLASARFDFRESDLTHSFSACLEADIPGVLPDTLVLVAPLSHPPGTPPDGDRSINAALALGVLERFARDTPPLSLKVLFLGAEYGGDPAGRNDRAGTAVLAGRGARAGTAVLAGRNQTDGQGEADDEYPMGSRLFLEDFYPEHGAMVLYLNLERVPSRLFLRSGGRGIESPYWLIDRVTSALKAANLFFLVRGNENQIFRIGLTSERTIIEPYLYAGYPAISFEGEYAEIGPAAQEQWIGGFYLFFSSLLERFADGVPETWDRHYLFFQARGFSMSISEKSYIIVLVTVLALALAYGLVFTRRLRRYLRLLTRNFWVLPIMLGFIFGLLFLGSWALEGILALRNMPELWAEMPLLFLAFKITIPLLLVFLILTFRHKMPIPRRGGFYSAAALLFLLLDVFVLAFVNISFTYYFLWAFAFGLLFAATANRAVKVLLFLAAPYWIVKTVVELFTLPRLEFCRVLLLSKIEGNLLIAAILLPFVLMFVRLKLVFPPLHIVTDRVRRAVTASVFAVVIAGLLSVFYLYTPYDQARPQPVTASYLIDSSAGENRLELSSPAPLGRIRIWDGADAFTVETRARELTVGLPPVEALLETPVSAVGFLDRKNLSLRLAAAGRPYRIGLRISSPQEFTLFDANFPYLREPGGREYSILVGANPPVPLTVELTVPQDRELQVEVRLDYLDPPTPFSVSGDNLAIDSRLTYRRVLQLRT